MSCEFNGIYPQERKKIGLIKSAGQFIAYDGEAPEIFSQPLVISGDNNGNKEGIKSGGRSAIIGRYKIKGCNPEEGKDYDGEPFGGMSPKKCLNELDSSKRVSDKYEEYGFAAPLVPLGRFEYEMQFNGKPVSCAILKCSGDTRISEAEVKLSSLYQRHPELWNYGYLDAILSGVAAWVGFDQRVLQEAEVAPAENSFDINNYVLYRVSGNGYGAARVDLSSALNGSESRKTLEKKKEFDLKEITRMPGVVCDVQIAKDFGFSYKDIRRGSHKGMGIELVVSNIEKEWKEENENMITLHVNEKRFEWSNNIRETYLKYVEGMDAPEPIDEKIIHPLFC
ncbi:MAG: hypothetical protein KKB25_02820 [Nanoarchaeota archaeon]|nr:hypothetical protein [Nanoarchaeota archaeon]